MPRLFEAVYKYSAGVTAIAAAVGTRIYEERALQTPTYPCIVAEEIDDERPHQFGANPTGAWRRLTIAAMSTVNQTDANTLADLFYAALMGQEAALTSAGGLTVQAVLFEDRRHFFEWDQQPQSAKVYATELDFRIFHNV